jgi:hypothetical protein
MGEEMIATAAHVIQYQTRWEDIAKGNISTLVHIV